MSLYSSGIPSLVDFNGIIFAYIYAVMNIYVCMQTYAYIYNTHTHIYNITFLSSVCVLYLEYKCYSLGWFNGHSASYVMWGLFEEVFRVFFLSVFLLRFAGEKWKILSCILLGDCHERVFELCVSSQRKVWRWPGVSWCLPLWCSGRHCSLELSSCQQRTLNCTLDCCWKPFRLWPVAEWLTGTLRLVRSQNILSLGTPYSGVRYLVT